ncbi:MULTISPECIES: hypothetical protein [Paenibacillus]|nr:MULTISPECIES: hypothetical protein [Paenibacillus]AZH28742.1 hypothetical protein EGM68_08180 [Paenibacillus sp. M-152]RTZ37890.1 hypothetical protein EJ573_01390 [Paenibacillus polymyxa]
MEIITKYLPVVGAGSLIALIVLFFKGIALINSSHIEKLLYKSNKKYVATTLSIILYSSISTFLCVSMSVIFGGIKTIIDLKAVLTISLVLSIVAYSIVAVILYLISKKKERVYYIKENLNGTDIELYLLKTTDEGYILLSDQPYIYSSTGFKILKKQEDILNKQIYSKIIS